MHNNRIIFIGGGNLAEAIFAKLDPTTVDIIVIQRNLQKITNLTDKYPHIQFATNLELDTTEEDIVILAVKPQDAKDACLSIAKLISKSTIVSVMAGIPVATLASWLDNQSLVRVMTNTPASVGYAASGIYFNNSINAGTQQLIKRIFNNVGKAYIFDDEDFIDKITPVVACSPAYVFYFIESMIETAINRFGFSEHDAKEMVLQVMQGSLQIITQNPQISLGQLRSNVASKKGTTQRAIDVFDKYNLKQIINEAETAAYNRAIEMANTFK